MSSWFDKLLEEMQRRQMEQDYAREGRPLPPRPPVGPPEEQIPDDDDGGDGPPPPRRLRPRRGRPERTPGNWVRPILFVVGVFILIQVLGGLVQLFTDLAWYGSLGRRDVLVTRFVAELGWFVVGLLLFVVPALASLWVARRLGPQVPIRKVGPVEVPDLSRPAAYVLVGVTVVLGLVSAFAWGGNWQTILLFFNGGNFGTTDASFGRDIGFYVFDLPFWRFVQGWAVLALAAIIGLTVGAYAVAATRWSFHLTAPVRAHVSLLGAGLLLAIAVGYQLDAAELVYSTRGIGGTVQAAMYTDMNAQVPAYAILTIVAVVSAGLLVANIFFRTLWLIGLAAGAWLVLSIVVGGFYPGAVQRFGVEPNELERERPFLERHLAATREAFDLDSIEERQFTGEQRITRALFEENEATLDNLRLWDYRPLLLTFGQQQILRQYYNFLDVDIDRYQIDDAQRQIMLSGREIEIDRLADAARTWTNERLVFTHGYGLTAVRSNAITPEGQPDYLISGINRNPDLPLSEPRIYFGEATTEYVVVRTRTPEFDYPTGDEGGETTSWTGDTGVPVDNVLSRLMFAIRFGDLNLLISDQLTADSAILFRRDIHTRAPELAPFLAYDRDPYLVNADNRLLWIWDAYTTTARYPNAQPLSSFETQFPGANYVRNSVKVVVDAYTGEVHYYVVDPDEPIIAAWSAIFPGLLEPMSDMPESLIPHLRYPEDLFTAQNTTYLLYHLSPTESGAGTFYNQDDQWSIPTQVSDVSGEGGPVAPYYVIMKVPGEDESEFVLIQPLVAANRPNMIAWIAARMDPGVYGERIEFRFPVDTTTLGPAQVQARINQDSRISEQFTLWSQAGSDVVRGDLLVLPMGDSILYVEPIYLRSTQSSFPEFKRVILADQTRVAFAETLDEGLRQILGEVAIPEPEPGGGGGGGGELPEDVASLIALAGQLYDEAQAALGAGDLGAYQDAVDELGRVLDRIAELTGTPAPAPSP
ncbi:MAG TPA: UPF0182 family protein [Candidatus Limnocylindria bacterium]|nr:UPF0182 family protein [Candidatus Limnocylindria bacterium]